MFTVEAFMCEPGIPDATGVRGAAPDALGTPRWLPGHTKVRSAAPATLTRAHSRARSIGPRLEIVYKVTVTDRDRGKRLQAVGEAFMLKCAMDTKHSSVRFGGFPPVQCPVHY